MREASAYTLIYLGTAVRFLQDTSPTVSPNSPGGVVYNFTMLCELCDEAGLPVGARAARQTLGELIERLKAEPEGYTLTEGDALAIREGMERIRVALDAEATGLINYAVEERRYDTTRLMGEMGKLFGPGVFEELTEIARYDFGESGRCLAFGVPTAAAFHLLRGTEEVLRTYYRSWKRRDRIRGNLMWGPMVADLRGMRAGPDRTALNHIDNIRVSFRNPTDHPEKIYDQSEADDLLGLCIEVVNRMVRTMRA